MTKKEEFIKFVQNYDNDNVKLFLKKNKNENIKLFFENNPTEINNSTIIIAATHGFIDIVKLILKDKKVNTSNAMSEAAFFNQYNIVQLLLKDKRTDPNWEESTPLRLVCQKGLLNIVQLLLKDKRVNPTLAENGAIRLANQDNHLDIVDLLWKDTRVKKTLKKDDKKLHKKLEKKDLEDKI
jgi:hypothetical protein